MGAETIVPIAIAKTVGGPVFRNGVTQIGGQGFRPMASSSSMTSSS